MLSPNQVRLNQYIFNSSQFNNSTRLLPAGCLNIFFDYFYLSHNYISKNISKKFLLWKWILVELKIPHHTITVQNITCQNYTAESSLCDHWKYDLILVWMKPDTNRSVSYLVRWGPKNPRQMNPKEPLVLQTSELGNTYTVCLILKIFFKFNPFGY